MNELSNKSNISGASFTLFLMAVMTLLWSVVAFYGLHVHVYTLALILFPLVCCLFVVKGFALVKAARLMPDDTDHTSIEADKKRSKKLNYVTIGEGLGILLGINIVNNMGHHELVVPVIALVTGLHFFPLAKMLDRPILYAVAVWSTGIAIAGIHIALRHLLPFDSMIAFTGIGMALATADYGLFTWLSVAGATES